MALRRFRVTKSTAEDGRDAGAEPPPPGSDRAARAREDSRAARKRESSSVSSYAELCASSMCSYESAFWSLPLIQLNVRLAHRSHPTPTPRSVLRLQRPLPQLPLQLQRHRAPWRHERSGVQQRLGARAAQRDLPPEPVLRRSRASLPPPDCHRFEVVCSWIKRNLCSDASIWFPYCKCISTSAFDKKDQARKKGQAN